jgi:hypothetical protein
MLLNNKYDKMRALWIIALCLHLIDDKRLESEYNKKPFIIQTVTEII